MIVTRFAPTLSGHMHIGTLYNAWLCRKFAQENNGTLSLRLDGQWLDSKGTRKGYADGIESDLESFGFTFDRVIRQHERKDLYRNEFIELVMDREDIYFCDCTPANILRRVVAGSNLWGIIRAEKYNAERLSSDRIGFQIRREYLYDNHCRDKNKKFDLDAGATVIRLKCWAPMVDVVLWAEGQPNLAWTSAFDDMELGVTHRIRGEDIRPFTWLEKEAALFLEYHAIDFFHGDIVDKDGKKLSKFTDAPRVIDCLSGGLTKEKIFEWFETLPGIGNTEAIECLPELCN